MPQNANTLSWTPAMELSTEQMHEILHGRKEIFDHFYLTVISNLKRNERKFFHYVSKYRDKNVDILSSAYPTNYCIFNLTGEDANIVYDVTGVTKKEVTAVITELKKFISDNCKLKGYSSPASFFENLTPFRVLLTLMMRYYLERGETDKLKIVCSYMGYSMFFTIFKNFFRYGVRKETMIYTINTLTNKHKLKQEGSVDGLLTYGVYKCMETYKRRVMDCTDLDVIYVVQQFKSRLRGYFKDIANKYFENDKNKEAVFSSSDRLKSEEGEDFVERSSTMGDVEKMAQTYSTLFFQKPIDEEILTIVARLNEAARPELKNALTAIRSDPSQIVTIKRFYESLFYLYSNAENGKTLDVHSRKFMSVMDSIYRKGNSKEKNISFIKGTLDEWLEKFSKIYRESHRAAKLNGYRKALFQYFIFVVALRK